MIGATYFSKDGIEGIQSSKFGSFILIEGKKPIRVVVEHAIFSEQPSGEIPPRTWASSDNELMEEERDMGIVMRALQGALPIGDRFDLRRRFLNWVNGRHWDTVDLQDQDLYELPLYVRMHLAAHTVILDNNYFDEPPRMPQVDVLSIKNNQITGPLPSWLRDVGDQTILMQGNAIKERFRYELGENIELDPPPDELVILRQVTQTK